MKRVLSNRMVAHVWAQQTQQDARSANGNFWFEGDTLYSYHTPVARMVTDVKGALVALISSVGYSPSTGKQLGYARAAAGYKGFSVPFIGVTGGRRRIDGEGFHESNMANFRAAYDAEKGRLTRQRDLWQPVFDSLFNVAKPAEDYATSFGLAYIAPDLLADAATIEAVRAARDAKRNTPEAIAKRARENERKAAKVRADYRAGGVLPGPHRSRCRLESLMTAEDQAIRAASLRASQADKIAAWYAGEHVPGLHFDAETGGAALRIKGDELQTSWGASVPLAHATRAFRFLKLCRERGEGWHCNGHSLHVGHFTVSEVHSDGSFIAGCHTFQWPEIERAAIAAGVFEAQATDDALTPSRIAS